MSGYTEQQDDEDTAYYHEWEEKMTKTMARIVKQLDSTDNLFRNLVERLPANQTLPVSGSGHDDQ